MNANHGTEANQYGYDLRSLFRRCLNRCAWHAVLGTPVALLLAVAIVNGRGDVRVDGAAISFDSATDEGPNVCDLDRWIYCDALLTAPVDDPASEYGFNGWTSAPLLQMIERAAGDVRQLAAEYAELVRHILPPEGTSMEEAEKVFGGHVRIARYGRSGAFYHQYTLLPRDNRDEEVFP